MLRTPDGQKIRVLKLMNGTIPKHIDWRNWIKRWDRMQDFYIPARKERFEIIVRLITDSQRKVSRVLDIGCGTGEGARRGSEAVDATHGSRYKL